MWFMKVLDGTIVLKDGAPALAKAAWCEPNSIDKLDDRYEEDSMKLKHIQDAGSVDKFRIILKEMMSKKKQTQSKH